MDTEMDIDHPTTKTKTKTKTNPTTTTPKHSATKTRILTTTTLRPPPFAYAHLTRTTAHNDSSSSTTTTAPFDNLQVRAYLTSALRQFLGDTGAAIPIDILLLRGTSVWVRVPHEDLAAFAAGVTAFAGVSSGDGETLVLQLRACGDWLGSLIGRDEEAGLWTA